MRAHAHATRSKDRERRVGPIGKGVSGLYSVHSEQVSVLCTLAMTEPGRPSKFMDLTATRSALIVAHPGHELRAHGWLELAKPTVFVLTDGSGRTARSRLGSTRDVLTAAGAKPAGIYRRFTDADVYGMIPSRCVRSSIGGRGWITWNRSRPSTKVLLSSKCVPDFTTT